MSVVAHIRNLGALTGTAGAITHARNYPWFNMYLWMNRIWLGSLNMTGITLDMVWPMLKPFSLN